MIRALRTTITLFLLINTMTIAQITNKPKLDFKVIVNIPKQEIEIDWEVCLENSVAKLLDNNLQVIKIQRLCEDRRSVIDIAGLQNDLYYVEIEHYTGKGIRPIIKANKEVDATSLPKNLKPSLDFGVYPNPAQKEVTITIDMGGLKSTITILDLQGKRVQQLTVKSSRTVIDMSSLPAGTYFFRLENEKGIGVKKITKS
ncbi:T9SS type A sorting domain-containing protein [Aureispira anguillae]|uniref:T9SS type A sorting domain-containing protein n=1 Tax=Aureispira anguillae TaxID=2864201 RepID=A0A915YBT9_9BACT|nr:T9SS type A sorting domain-containing protein [Aureispira anguillae]BDS10193.1 T9SS type A sorting domain-containing protein [Aureispira anguillae]